MKKVNERDGRCFAVIRSRKKKTLRNELLKEDIFPEYQVVEKSDQFWICLDSYNGDLEKRINKAKTDIKEYLNTLRNDLNIDISAIFVHDNFKN